MHSFIGSVCLYPLSLQGTASKKKTSILQQIKKKSVSFYSLSKPPPSQDAESKNELSGETEVDLMDLGSYSPTILENILSLVFQNFLQLAAFECNTTSDWLNRIV